MLDRLMTWLEITHAKYGISKYHIYMPMNALKCRDQDFVVNIFCMFCDTRRLSRFTFNKK